MTDDTRGAHRNGEQLPSNEQQPRPTRPFDKPTDQAAEELTRLARIPEENPDPVFRISAGHVLLYRNPAGEKLCRVWGCRLGQRVPTAIGALVSAALADGAVARHEVAFGSRDYWLTVAPAVADGYVNLYARDVTDHKRTEEALRQTEQKFRTIFDNTSDGIFLHDLETQRLIMGNKSCLQMLGYTEEEFVQLGIADLHPEADLPFIRAQIEKFLQGGEPIRHDIRFKRKDGSILLADVSPDLVQLNGTRYVLVALKDITERKRMEEELRRSSEHLAELVETRTGELEESETKYRSLYHTIADGIFVMGADGQIEDVNDSACAQLGYTREELIGMPVAAISARADFHPGEILDKLRAAGSLSYETAHRRKDGVTIPVELSVTLIEYRGQPAVLGVARDIAERKQAQEALQFTQFAVDHMADAAFWMTEDGRFCYVNEAACQALGHSREELLQMTVFDIDPSFTASLWAERWREMKAKKSIVLETVHQARDGKTYPVEIRANYLEFGGRAYDCAFARDITERKQAEQTLRLLSRKNEEALQVARMGHWELDLATAMFTFNDQYYTLHGTTAREAGGYQVTAEEFARKYVHPDDAHLVQEHLQRAVAADDPEFQVQVEARILRTDGEARWVTVWFRIEKDAQGKTIKLHGVNQDITERKRAEEALRKSEALYQDLVETSQDLIWQCDLEGRYTYLNPAWETTFGYSLEEMLGKPFWLFQPPPYAQRDQREFSRLIQGTTAKGYETVHRGKDGREIHLVFNAKSVQDEHGKIVGTRGAAYDITERKRAEETLQASEARFKNIVNASPLGMHLYELQDDGRLVFVGANPAADEILGVSHAPFVGRTIEEAFPGLLQTEVPARYRDAARHGTLWRTEQINYDEGLIRGAFEVVAFQTEPGKMVAIFNDITERKQAEEALRVSEEHYRSLFDNMLNGFSFCRMLFEGDRPVDFVYLEVNRAFESLTGLKDVTGKKASEVIPGIQATNPELLEVYGRVALTGRPEQFETYVKPLGMWFLLSVYSPRREHFVAVFDVITERKRAEEALRQSESRYRKLFEANLAGVYLTKLDGTILDFNDAMRRMLGYDSREEVFQHRSSDFYAEAEFRQELMRLLQKDGVVPAKEAVLRRKDGSILHALGSAVLLVNEQTGEPYIQGASIDITERKQAEEALRELNATLEAKVAQRTEDLRHTVGQLRQLTLELSQAEDRERKRIADILHEDVQQTLAAAKFHLNLLGNEAYNADEVREIVEQVKHMLKDAIEKSRNLSHELSPAMYQVELLEILNWLARHMREKHGLTVHVEAHGPIDSPSEPLKAFLYKVVQELLFNVVKHAGVSAARIRVRRMGQSLWLSVVDQGCGFDPQRLEKAGGFGLLGIRERIQLLGGCMRIRSTPGAGSRFLLAVPYETTTQVAVPAEGADGYLQAEARTPGQPAEKR